MDDVKFFRCFKNTRKALTSLIIAILFTSNFLFAQTASITWQLTTNQNVSEINGPLYGFNQSLSGMVVNRYNIAAGEAVGYCQFLDIIGGLWPGENNQVKNRYIQFAVVPKAGITFNINTISLYYSGFGGHNMQANVAYSTDSSFSVSTQLNQKGKPLSNSDNAGDMKLYNYSVSAKIEYGQIFYLRIYPWYIGNLYTKYVCVQNVSISGTTSGEVTPQLPIISTTPIYNVSTTTAISGGDISFDGESNITAKGICWSTKRNPTIDNNSTNEGTGKGKFESILTGLEISTKYYVRAYAVNAVGVSYGLEDSLVTLNKLNIPVVVTGANFKVVGRSVTLGAEITE